MKTNLLSRPNFIVFLFLLHHFNCHTSFVSVKIALFIRFKGDCGVFLLYPILLFHNCLLQNCSNHVSFVEWENCVFRNFKTNLSSLPILILSLFFLHSSFVRVKKGWKKGFFFLKEKLVCHVIYCKLCPQDNTNFNEVRQYLATANHWIFGKYCPFKFWPRYISRSVHLCYLTVLPTKFASFIISSNALMNKLLFWYFGSCGLCLTLIVFVLITEMDP